MSNVTPQCRWLPALAHLRFCLHLREQIDEWSAAAALQDDDIVALENYRRVSVLQAILHSAYPQFVYAILDSIGRAPAMRQYEEQCGLFRCAGEATIALFRMDHSEMIQRELSAFQSEMPGILEFAKCHIREALQPIVRHMHPCSHGQPVRGYGRYFSLAAEQMFLAWVQIRVNGAVSEVDGCISAAFATSELQLSTRWDAATYANRLTKADSFSSRFIPDVCRTLSTLPAVVQVLES